MEFPQSSFRAHCVQEEGGTKGCDSGIESGRQLGKRQKRMLDVASLGCQPDTPGKQELQLRKSLHQTGLWACL